MTTSVSLLEVNATNVQKAYIAYFGRPADPEGINFWTTAGTSGTTMLTIMRDFGQSAEFNALYGAGTNAAFVNAVYMNVFGRTADAGGLNFYVNALGAGTVTRADVVFNILNGATGADAAIVENKVAFATQFTTAMASNVASYVNYNPTFGIPAARTELAKVTGASTAAGITAAVTASINTIAVGPVVTPVAQTFTLTATADNVMGGAAADTIVAGSVQGGGAHTLGAADSIDGGAGVDTLKLVEDRTGGGNTGTLFPRMANVERVEIQALTPAAVDFTNTTGIQTLVSDRSVQAVTVTNLRDDATLVVSNSTAALSVDYAANAVLDTVAKIELSNANGATVTFATPTTQESSIATLDLKVDGAATTLSSASVAGLNATGALRNVILSGGANVTFTGNMADDAGAALFKDVTSVDARNLTGTLTLDLLGDGGTGALADRNITFNGGNGNTRLTIGQGNNAVTLGSGNDLLIVSSTGFNQSDSVNGGAGQDQLEVHFNPTIPSFGTVVGGTTTTTNGLDDATDAVVQAINAAQNFETLVVDVWTQTTENVNLKADLFTVNNFAFQDTSTTEPAGPGTNGTVDADIEGVVAITGVRDVNSFALRSDFTSAVTATAASGATTLNVSVAGGDAVNDGAANFRDASGNLAQVADVDEVALLTAAGFSAVNLTLTNVDNAATAAVNEAGVARASVRVDDSAVVKLAGSVLAADVTLQSRDVAAALTGATAAFGATLDASGITTTANRVLNATSNPTIRANNLSVDVNGNNVLGASILGTNQDDNITGTNGNDSLVGNAGADVITTLIGLDTVVAGDGNDIVVAGEGVKTINLGAGDDRVQFANTLGDNLTSADMVDGGAGRDTLAVTDGGVVIADAVFNQMTDVEIIELSNGSTATLNAIANARSFDTVSAAATASITVNLQEGFTRGLNVNLSTGVDTVNATTAPGAVTVNANAAAITAADAITGGTSAGDRLVLTADNGAANLSGLRAVETVTLVSDANTGTTGALAGVEDVTVVVGSDNVLAANRTLTIDGSALTSRTGGTALDRPDVVVDATAFSTTTKRVNVSTAAGFDAVYGGAGGDTVSAGAGDDTVYGGGGADQLSGGAGADRFTYGAVSDSSNTSTDTITDFVGGTNGDRVVVADVLLGGRALRFAGNQANFGAAQGATTAGDNLIDYVFQQDTNTLWVDINNDGTLNADDLQIKLQGVTTVANGDVISAPVVINSTGTLATLPAVARAFAVNATTQGNSNVFVNGADSTVTTFAGVTPAVAAIDTLRLGGTTNISGAGVPAATFASVTMDAASQITMTAAQHTAFVAPATTTKAGLQTVVLSDQFVGAAAAGIENYTLANIAGNNITVLATTNVDASAASADTITVGGLTVTGTYTTGATDTIAATAGANLSGATLGNATVLSVGNSAGTFTMTQAQHQALTTVNDTTNAQVFALTTAGAVTARASIETYNLAAGTNTITVQAGTNVNGNTGADTVNVSGTTATGTYALAVADTIQMDTTADISGVNAGAATGAGALKMDAAATITATMTLAQHNGFTGITAAGGNDTIVIRGAGGTLSGNAGIQTYELGSTTGATQTFNFTIGSASQNVLETVVAGGGHVTNITVPGNTTVTGAFANLGGDDKLIVGAGANLSGAAAGANTVAGSTPGAAFGANPGNGNKILGMDLAGAVTMTLLQHQSVGLTTTGGITATGGVNSPATVTLTTAGTVDAKTNVSTYTLSDAAANTINVLAPTSVDARQNGGTARADTIAVGANVAATGVYQTGSTDIISLATGANIAGVSNGTTVGAALTAVNLTLADNAAVSMTVAQHQGFSGTTTAGATETVTLTTAGTVTGKAQIENYNLAAGANNFTFAATTAQTVVGSTGADTITVTLGATNAPGAVVTNANLGVDSVSDRVNIANSGSNTTNSFESVTDNVAGYLAVTNFNPANDVLALSLVNTGGTTNLNAGYQSFNAVGALTQNTNGSIWEIESGIGLVIDPTNLTSVKNLIANAVGTATVGANHVFGVVVYSASGAALYNIKVTAVAGGDFATTDIATIELVGTLGGVAANALTVGNFA